MNRKKLYFIVIILSIAGYAWLILNYYHISTSIPSMDICLFKKITGIPCPSCGSTHSLVFLLNGNFKEAVVANPLGILLALMLIIFPVWIIIDILANKAGFYFFYSKAEALLRKKRIAIPAIVFVLAIWIMNIYKST
jgi:hypothetical protein